jgi:hypothetical protein
MLSIEIRVNGNPVGQVSAYRGGMVEGLVVDPTFAYPYRASFFPIDHTEGATTYEGRVDHRFNEGMEKLAAKILADIAKNSPQIDSIV